MENNKLDQALAKLNEAFDLKASKFLHNYSITASVHQAPQSLNPPKRVALLAFFLL